MGWTSRQSLWVKPHAFLKGGRDQGFENRNFLKLYTDLNLEDYTNSVAYANVFCKSFNTLFFKKLFTSITSGCTTASSLILFLRKKVCKKPITIALQTLHAHSSFRSLEPVWGHVCCIVRLANPLKTVSRVQVVYPTCYLLKEGFRLNCMY